MDPLRVLCTISLLLSACDVVDGSVVEGDTTPASVPDPDAVTPAPGAPSPPAGPEEAPPEREPAPDPPPRIGGWPDEATPRRDEPPEGVPDGEDGQGGAPNPDQPPADEPGDGPPPRDLDRQDPPADPDPDPEPDPDPDPDPDPAEEPEDDPDVAPEPDLDPSPRADRPAPPNPADAPEPPDSIDPPPADLGVPMIEVLGPNPDATFPADSSLDVVARITDVEGVASASLQWAFNGNSYACPSENEYVSCQVDGDEYRWTVSVGAVAERPFIIRARNTRRRMTSTPQRSVWVRHPDDPDAPVVVLLAPTPDAVWQANSVVRVQARIRDEQRVASVGLDWGYTDEVFDCPLRSQYVDCTVQGDLYTWDLTVGSGQRRFSVVATDGVGNEGRSPERSLQLQ